LVAATFSSLGVYGLAIRDFEDKPDYTSPLRTSSKEAGLG